MNATSMGANGYEEKLRALVRAERIIMLYRQLPTSVSGNLFGAALVAGTLLGDQPLTRVGGWLACVILLQGSRLWLHVHNNKTGFVLRSVDRAAMVWAAGAGVSGMLWGSTALLFFVPGEHIYQAVLTVAVFGITASAIPLIGSHFPSFYAFVLPALVPFIVRNALERDLPHYVLSLILVAVTLGLFSFARNYNRMLTESLRNRFEKEALAEKLAAQNVDLERARVASDDANRVKTQFFAAASHDLRQPLHAMGLFAAALTDKVRDPEAAGIVASVNDSVHALEGLFNELLDISKLDSGVIKPALSDFALDRVLDRLCNEFTAEADAKGLRLSMPRSGLAVHSDRVLLERIIRNLVSNALRYTTAGEVSVTAARSDTGITIEVRDTGIGIRPEDQQRIFEEFFQLGNPARTSKKGLGLGLSIVQRLCELLGYSMRVTSEYGKGSTFAFELPVGTVSAGDHAPQQAVVARHDLQEKLIVVIDDESAIVEGMKVLLTGWGAEVIASTTGADVIAGVHAAGRMPDLIIIDHRLGLAEDGLELGQRLREELDPAIPAILVTGSMTPDLAAQARAAGFEFMLKPVNPAQLRQRIDAALGIEQPAL